MIIAIVKTKTLVAPIASTIESSFDFISGLFRTTFDHLVMISEPWREYELLEIRHEIIDFVSTARFLRPILNWANMKAGMPKWG